MPKVRHVHADLMRSAGLQPKAQKRNAPVGLLHLIAGAALLAAVADLAGDGAALFDADGRVHNAAAVHLPAAQRIVGLVDLMCQRIGDVRTFRHRQKPARVAVKAADGAKGQRRPRPLKIADNGVCQRRFGLSRRRMHRQKRRFVYDKQVRVLKNNRKRHVRPLDLHRVGRHGHRHRLPRPQAVDGAAVHAVGDDAVFHALELHDHAP